MASSSRFNVRPNKFGGAPGVSYDDEHCVTEMFCSSALKSTPLGALDFVRPGKPLLLKTLHVPGYEKPKLQPSNILQSFISVFATVGSTAVPRFCL